MNCADECKDIVEDRSIFGGGRRQQLPLHGGSIARGSACHDDLRHIIERRGDA
jgi:hypothetical protein